MQEGSNFLIENWEAILIGLLAFVKVIVNLTPSEKDNNLFVIVDKIINAIIPNRKKGGGAHDYHPIVPKK